jgi:Zn ribbon nucleic-acid-binding protein
MDTMHCPKCDKNTVTSRPARSGNALHLECSACGHKEHRALAPVAGSRPGEVLMGANISECDC